MPFSITWKESQQIVGSTRDWKIDRKNWPLIREALERKVEAQPGSAIFQVKA